MNKQIFSAIVVILCMAPAVLMAANAQEPVPKPFVGFDPNSTYKIKYDDLNAMLKLTVVKTGRSNRDVAAPVQVQTGTRQRQTSKSKTSKEGNRFYFEIFDKDEKTAEYLHELRKSLESVPDQAPLELFSRDEQLAYWLNLYNIVLIDEIVQVYPKRKLKKYLVGKKSILDKKTMTLSGVSLSLNDIENTILAQNYDHNPLVLYGLYQGIIGGPNIRKTAYTGKTVYAALEDNAEEFINSNRGTYSRGGNTFRVSSYYGRNLAWFDDSDAELKKHLEKYIQNPEKTELEASSRIKPDINDWAVTDLYGSHRDFGGSLANNSAALLDSMNNEEPFVDPSGGGLTMISTNFSAASGGATAKSPSNERFSPELIAHMQNIDARRMQAAKGDATVTVEELGEVATEPAPDSENENEIQPANDDSNQ